MQRFKTHPMIRDTFEGAQAHRLRRPRHHGGRLAIGAAARLPGRLPRRRLGRLRERAAHQGLAQRDPVRDALRRPPRDGARRRARARRGRRATRRAGAAPTIGRDLYRVRNVKPLWSQLRHARRHRRSAASTCGRTSSLGFSLFGTLAHGKPDFATLKPIKDVKPIAYPRPDGVLTFDRLSSVFLSNTNHEEDQPVHLKVKDMALQKRSEHDVFGGPSSPLLPGRRLRVGRGGRRSRAS